MNKHILTIAVTGFSLLSFGQLAFAHEEDEENPSRVYENRDSRYNDPRDNRRDRDERDTQLQFELDHLKRMLIHVDRELRTYAADRYTWREYRHMRAEAEQLKNQLRRGEQYYNRGRILAQIQHIHDELHQIEQQLHVPANAWFQCR